MSTQVTAAYTGIMLTPIIFGVVAQKVGTHIFPYFLGGAVVLLFTSTVFVYGKLKRKK